MRNQTPSSQAERGAILLPLALFIFIISLGIAGYVANLVRVDRGGAWQSIWSSTPAASTVPSPTPSLPPDPLNPAFSLDPTLTPDYSQLEKNLLKPLRAYYATRPERLLGIAVVPATETKHTTQVILSLQHGSEKEQRTFFFDKDENDVYPAWTAKLLEQPKGSPTPTPTKKPK